MKIIILTILTLLFSYFHLYSYWKPMNGPNGITVLSIKGDDDVIYAANYYGSLFTSINKGTNWSYLEYFNDYITSIAVDGQKILIGTYQNGLFLSDDKGLTWENLGFTDEYITSVDMKGDIICIGINTSGVVISSDAGKTWLTQHSYMPYGSPHSNTYVFSVYIYEDIIIISVYGGVYYTKDFGQSWEKIQDDNVNIAYNFINYKNNLYCTNYNDGIYILNKNDMTFDKIGSTNLKLYSFAILNNNIYAVSDEELFFYNEFLNSWIKVSGIPNHYKPLYTFAINGYLYICTTQNGILLSTDNGVTWVEKNLGLTYTDTFGLKVINNDLYAITPWYLMRNNLLQNEWMYIKLGIENRTPDYINFDTYEINEKYILLSSPLFRIQISTDNGHTWNSSERQFANVSSLLSKDDKIFIGSSDGDVNIINSGVDDRIRYNIGLPNGSINQFLLIDDIIFLASSEGVFYSDNDGEYWLFSGLNYQDIHCLYFDEIERIIYAGTNKGLYMSEDMGVTWNNIGLNHQKIKCIIKYENYIFVGTESSGVFFKEPDRGVWLERNRYLSNFQITSFEIYNEVIFVSTLGGGIFQSNIMDIIKE